MYFLFNLTLDFHYFIVIWPIINPFLNIYDFFEYEPQTN